MAYRWSVAFDMGESEQFYDMWVVKCCADEDLVPSTGFLNRSCPTLVVRLV